MATNSEIRLEASIVSQTAAEIAISYALENRTPRTVYVCDLLFRTNASGDRSYDAELAYAYPQSSGRLLIGKLLVPIPPGKKAEAPEIPLWRALAPSQERSGRVRVSLPVAPFHPYLAPRRQMPLQMSQGFDLAVGVLDPSRAKPGEALLSPGRAPDPELFVCDYGLGLAYQEIFRVNFPGGLPYYPLG
jgi:hypothetical protein